MTERPILHLIRPIATGRESAAKLSAVSDGYRVAVAAYRLAADLGCSGDLFDALWDLVEREAAAAEAQITAGRQE